MFKVGDFALLSALRSTCGVVTRVYDDVWMAIGFYDELDGMLFDECKVKQQYFRLANLDSCPVKGLSYRKILEDLIDAGYFSREKDGSIKFNYSEDSKDGIEPSLGLPSNEFLITAI